MNKKEFIAYSPGLGRGVATSHDTPAKGQGRGYMNQHFKQN